MNNKTFQHKYKIAICTNNPIKYLIPYNQRYEVIKNIKNECVEIYGQDIMQECDKRMVCFGKTCLGRDLAWKSPTALPYLEKLKQRGLVEPDGKMYMIGCKGCQINKTCQRPCFQVNDYVTRQKKKEPFLIFKHTVDNFEVKSDKIEEFRRQNEVLSIPWDSISEKKSRIVRSYLFELLDFQQVAKKFHLINQAEAKYLFYSALTTMSKVAVMRKFLRKNKEKLTRKQIQILTSVFIKNNTITEAAKEYNLKKQSAQQIIARVIRLYNLKFQKFVRKHNGRVIYSVPALLK